ncbi:MAG: TonB-dependent receptor [Acidobacteria bacterium]|nr:TonB-dependent receptor [Acidobacteriota bacterium]
MRIVRAGIWKWLAAGLLGLALSTAAQTPAPPAELFGHVLTEGADGQTLYLTNVKIVLVSRADARRRFEAASDETGSYSVKELPPGAYRLTATQAAYEEFIREISLEPGTLLEVTVTLTLKPVLEEVTVSGQAPGIQAKQTTPKAEVAQQILQNAPLVSERFQDALPLLPGVVRGSDGLLNIKGVRSAQAGWLVNSANVADPVTGERAINLPVDVIQEVEVLPSPYSAEYGKFTGAVTSVETRPATEKFKFNLQNFVPRPRRRNGSIRGLESVLPRMTLSGPLVEERLSFLQSFEYRFVRAPITSLPELERDQELESFDSFTQLDLTLSPQHFLNGVFSLYPQKNRYATLNTFNPQDVTANYRQAGWFVGLRDRLLLGSRGLLESSFSAKDFDARIFPAQASLGEFILRPERAFGEFFNTQARNTRLYEWLQVYTLPEVSGRGTHYVKLGVNLAHQRFHGEHANRPVRIERGDGTLAERIEFAGSTGLERNKTEFTLFFQDKWNPHRRLTLDLGLRYDRDTLARENLVAPRFGLAYLLTDDNRTVVRGGVGLFYDKIPLNVAYFGQLQQRRVTRFAADGVTILDGPRLFVHQLEGGRLLTPRSLAFNAELDRELRPGWLVRIGYQQREGRREYTLNPFDDIAGVPTLLLAPAGRSRYREFQLTTNYHFGKSNFLTASYVRSRATGHLNSFQQFFGNFEDPVIRPDERSRLGLDIPNRFLLWGEVRAPFNIILAPVVEVRDGFPVSVIDAERSFVGPRNLAGRFPAFATFDIQILRDFRIKAFGKVRTVRVGVKMFNLLRHFNPRDFQSNLDALDAGTFYNSRGRLFRGKLAIDF